MPRRNLDLESAIDLVSQNEGEDEDDDGAASSSVKFTDPILAVAERDYRTRTHVDQYKTMENMMKHKRRLVNENELP